MSFFIPIFGTALILIFFFSFLSLFFSCDDKGTGPNNNANLNLTIEDASCIEVWLKLEVNNPALKIENLADRRNDVIIYRDNVEIKRINNILSNDTIIFDEGLLPNKEYTYQAKKIISEKEHIASEEIKAQTMDTTSHNFTWETFTFGDPGAGSSHLSDVAIIDQNNIWAVGEIYMNDSLGNPDPHAYNAVHWDGKNWELKRIYTHSSCNPVDYAPLKAIWAFSDSNIVITGGGSIDWFNGKVNKADCNIRPLLTGSINKLWAISSNDLYAVGNNGNIAHYQNGRWSKIESGTTLNINDIWGDYNEKTGEWEILAVASNVLESRDKEFLQINNQSVKNLSTEPIDGTLNTLWFISNKKYFVGGGGIYKKKLLNDSLWNNDKFEITRYYTYRISGIEINDIVASGGFGELLHFNGFSWHSYIDKTMIQGNYYGLAFQGNIIITVGINNPQAVITIGKRIEN